MMGMFGTSTVAFAEEGAAAEVTDVQLDLSVAIADGTYSWQPFDEDEDGVIDYYGLMYVYFCSNVTSPQYQYLKFYVPADYLTVD
ncbi:MAG: hypothetical protein LUF30_08870, partial [Lachnospiraceae bacterium]|nr:hypothetical protein [Lachnospiraceae bacterium]